MASQGLSQAQNGPFGGQSGPYLGTAVTWRPGTSAAVWASLRCTFCVPNTSRNSCTILENFHFFHVFDPFWVTFLWAWAWALFGKNKSRIARNCFGFRISRYYICTQGPHMWGGVGHISSGPGTLKRGEGRGGEGVGGGRGGNEFGVSPPQR